MFICLVFTIDAEVIELSVDLGTRSVGILPVPELRAVVLGCSQKFECRCETEA